MGSMIYLAVGRLEVDWGKNSGFTDHSALFQGEQDVSNVQYYYTSDSEERDGEVTIITELKEGLSKPLFLVADRIRLMGYTLAFCEQEFNYLAEINGFDIEKFSFRQLGDILRTVDVNSLSADYGEGGEDFGKFFSRQILPRLVTSGLIADERDLKFEVAHGMENLSSYTILTLLSENPSARNLPVTWAFNDLDVGGWATRDEFVRELDGGKKFLIVTEGSSDAAILKHAFRLLRPHIADFFEFVDMEDGYPFSGTGNLTRFVQGLISIKVQNNVIVLFDNDAEGIASWNRCLGLNVPANMRILKLPDRQEFQNFNTIGPEGEHRSNINGLAAAIECYLHTSDASRIRWTSFNTAVCGYQGELEAKDRYKKIFLEQRTKTADYDYSKIEAVLELIVQECVEMRERAVLRELVLSQY